MDRVVFSHAARYRASGGAPSVVSRPLDSSGGRSFERAAASRIGKTLEIFDIPAQMRNNLITEAEHIEEVANLNPAMLAAAQIFFRQTRNHYSDEQFRTIGREIVTVLENNDLVEKRDNDPEKEANMLNLLRYICIIGSARGYRNLPPFVST